MELTMTNEFCEMTQKEAELIEGGEWSDFFEAINPLNLVDYIYQLGQDFGAAGVKFGRELYDFGSDLKKIFS